MNIKVKIYFVKTIVALIFGIGITQALQARELNDPLPRKEVHELSDDEVAKLRQAVGILKGRDFSYIKSWAVISAIHGIRHLDPEFKKAPENLKSFFNQCHNSRQLFFAWHRAYVHYVERLMQEALGDIRFRLPYWDWYKYPHMPKIFRKEFVKGGKNPLFRADRKDGINDGQAVWEPKSSGGYSLEEFKDYQNLLNSTDHRVIHSAIGGSMSDGVTAAEDPLFFLHHANIDRLLVAWKKHHDTKVKAPTSSALWASYEPAFPISEGQNWKPSIAELELNELSQLEYRYEDLNIATDIGPLAIPEPPKLRVDANSVNAELTNTELAVALFEDGPLEISGPVSLKLSFDESKNSSLIKLMEDKKSRLFITLKSVDIEEWDSDILQYRVFLGLEKNGNDYLEHFVGSLDEFGLSMFSHKEKTDISFELSAKNMEFLSSRKDVSDISVSFVPLMKPGATHSDFTLIKIGNIYVETDRN